MLATCAAACTPASVRPAAFRGLCAPTIACDLFLEDLLNADPVDLPLPARVIGPVVRDVEFQRTRHVDLKTLKTSRPRFARATPASRPEPCWQSGQSSGWYVFTSIGSSA